MSALLSYAFVGIGCGYHRNFELICVIDLAGGYDDYLEQLQSRKPDRPTNSFAKSQAPESPSKKYMGGSRNSNQMHPNFAHMKEYNKENESPGTWGKSASNMDPKRYDPR